MGCSASLLGAALLPAAVDAQIEGEPAGFIPGEATAQASTLTLGLSPGGGKPLEIVLGKSTARYQNRTATAEGTALSLGLLQIFFGPSSACGDRPPIIPADQLPPLTTNDSRRNQPMATALEVRSPGYNGTSTTPGQLGGVIGTQIANASATPQSSTAGTTTVSQDYGILAIDNGSTQVTTQLSGGVRTATAVMTASRIRILGDMVVINSPRWEASTTSGGTETATGTFTFASATILGIDRTVANFPGDFNDFASGVASFLSALGVSLQYPKLVTEPGRVTMTPIVVGLNNPPIGLDFIQPLLKAIAPLREESNRKMISEDCNNQAILQVADLALGILSGSGAVSLSAGGVTAFTAATEFPEPPALEIPDLDAPTIDAPVIDVPTPVVTAPPVAVNDLTLSRSTGSTSSSFAADDLGSSVVESAPPLDTGIIDTAPVAAPVAEATGPGFELPSAELVSRRIEPGTKGGTAALVGAGGLVGLLLLAGADRFVMKRTKREMPD